MRLRPHGCTEVPLCQLPVTGVDFTGTVRHFFASALISGGASVKQVQSVLGHASAVITLQTYSHLWPGDDDRTRDVMDAALSPLADSLRTTRPDMCSDAGQRACGAASAFLAFL